MCKHKKESLLVNLTIKKTDGKIFERNEKKLLVLVGKLFEGGFYE